MLANKVSLFHNERFIHETILANDPKITESNQSNSNRFWWLFRFNDIIIMKPIFREKLTNENMTRVWFEFNRTKKKRNSLYSYFQLIFNSKNHGIFVEKVIIDIFPLNDVFSDQFHSGFCAFHCIWFLNEIVRSHNLPVQMSILPSNKFKLDWEFDRGYHLESIEM